MEEVGKILTFSGVIFLLLSLIFNIVPNLPKIPGDIYIEKSGIRIYIPITSAIILSLLLTIVFNFFRK